MITRVLAAAETAEAAALLRGGGIVAFPTETVYGLGAAAFDPAAVSRLYAAKGRPEGKALSLLIPDAEALDTLCREVPEAARVLAALFWPGPLTLVLLKNRWVPKGVTAGLDTVGVRCPRHPAALALLRALGEPVAAPSANRSGNPPATDAAGVLRELGGRIDAVMDGGVCLLGTASTVLDLTAATPRILRKGEISRAALSAALGVEIG